MPETRTTTVTATVTPEARIDTTPTSVPVTVVNNSVVVGWARRWVIACGLFLLGGLFGGYQVGHKFGEGSVPVPALAPSGKASIPVQAAVGMTKGDEERYRQLEARVDRVEGHIFRQSVLTTDLVQATHLHMHAADGAVLLPHDAGGVPMVPVAPKRGH